MSTQAKVVIIAVVIALSAAWRFARPSRVQDQRVGGEIERGVLRANDGSGAIELAQAPSAREPLNAEPATAAVSAAVRSEDESLELRGRVVDGSDAPVEGAEIVAMFAPGRTFDYLGDMDYWNEQHRVANARSDSAGEFAFKLDKFGPFDLHVRAEHLAEAVVADVMTDEFVVIHARRGATLYGHVKRSADGAPVASASVILRNDQVHDAVFEGKTDAGGNYRAVAIAPGKFLMQVVPDIERRRNIEIELREGEEKLVDVDVEDGSRVCGEVRDKLTGRPIAGAEVSAWSFLEKTVRTDASGRYALFGVDVWRNLVLKVRAPGYGQLGKTIDSQASAASSIDFALSPGRVLRGRIVSRTGALVAGAYVGAFSTSTDEDGDSSDVVAARSAADGRFEIHDLCIDVQHVLFVRKEGSASVTLPLPQENAAEPVIDVGDVALPTAACLSGRVTDERGDAIAGAMIFWEPKSEGQVIGDGSSTLRTTTSDDRGRFRLDDLAAGRFSMRFVREGLRTLKDLEIDLAEGEARRDFHVTMESLLSIEGRVLDPFGNGLPNALVWTETGAPHEGGPRDDVEASTAEDGSFKIASLSAGLHALHVVPRGLLAMNGERIELARANLADVAAGAKDVRIALARAARITGLVRTASREPAAHAGVVARDRQGLEVDTAYADAAGCFRLTVAEDSTVDLAAYSSRPAPETVSGYSMIDDGALCASARSVRSGSSGIELRLPK